MPTSEDPHLTVGALSRQLTRLEEQVKKFVAAERIQYDLQSQLDLQLKVQAELLRLSERLHRCRDETRVGQLVAEALVENFGFEKAIVGTYGRSTGLPLIVAVEGYYDEEEAAAVMQEAPRVIGAPGPGEDDLRMNLDTGEPCLGMDETVVLACRSSMGEILGCIAFGTNREQRAYHRPMDPKDRPLWESIASLTSIALENARLYGQLAWERESLKRTRDHLRELNEHLEGVVRDRTKELTESESKFRQLYLESHRTGQMYLTLLDASPDPIVVYDIEGRPTYLNPAFTRVFGWTFDELKGRRIDFVPPENWPETNEMIQMVLNGISFSNRETRRRTKDGRIIDVNISGSIFFDEQGKAAGSVIHLRDITDRKKLEDELFKMGKLQAVGLLAGGIAHDFNNILAGILVNAQLAGEMLDEGESRVLKYLKGIEQATERATALTQQLLTFARGGAPVRKTASIAQFIKESVGFVLRGSNVRCEFALPEELWPVEIDQGQMSQVINNLIINAVQAMNEGGIIMVGGGNVAVTEEMTKAGLPLKPGRYVKVSIRDQGRGIPEEHLQRIFDPYFSTKVTGTGLGLAITFSIIARHHGHISVDSQVGQGSTFHVYLPASEELAPVGTERERRATSGAQGRILMMDDEETLRTLATDLLTTCGFEVETAANGDEAIELYARARSEGKCFDLVIMDLTIPGGMGGKETIRRLLEIDPCVNAVVCSGYSNDPVMADFKSHGFKGVVSKPYRIEQLIEELHNVLESHTHQRP